MRVPQFAQNLEPGGHIVWQAGQGFGCGGASEAPHSAQNFPGGTCALHAGHAIRPEELAGEAATVGAVAIGCGDGWPCGGGWPCCGGWPCGGG